MKRIYLAAVAALALGMTANAAITSFTTGEHEMASLSKDMVKVADLKSSGLVMKAPTVGVKKAAPDPSIMYGTYESHAVKPFQGEEYEDINFGTVVVGPGSQTGYVTLDGLFFGYQIECPVVTVELKDGSTLVGFRLTNGQNLGELTYADGTFGHEIETLQWNDSGQGTHSIDYMDIFFMPSEFEVGMQIINNQITSAKTFSKGFISYNSQQICLAKIKVVNSYQPVCNMGYDYALLPIEEYLGTGIGEFEYNASEWEDAGNATISTCGYLDCLFNEPCPAYTVPVKVKKGMPSQALLINPFQNEWFSKVEGFTFNDGYIYLDLSNEGFPLVRPLVPSGLFLDGGDGNFYCSNEGARMVYMEGADVESAKAMFEMMGYDFPTLDDSNVLTLPNAKYALSGAIDNLKTWTFANNEVQDMTTVIELPGTVVASVKGIEVDEADVNAPARYFNLQGVEISAPAKGEVVIVKKGGKAVKTVF